MNDLLQLKGHFEQRKAPKPVVINNLPKNACVDSEHIHSLERDLDSVLSFWEQKQIVDKPLVCVEYTSVVAKSHRVSKLLVPGSSVNEVIVGAKFVGDLHKRHVITHCINIETIRKTKQLLHAAFNIVNNKYDGTITTEDIFNINKRVTSWSDAEPLKRNAFVAVIVDAYYVNRFYVDLEADDFEESTIITIYDTGIKISELLRRLNIDYRPTNVIDDTTLLLLPYEYELLKEKAPYLIAMAVSDISQLDYSDFDFEPSSILTIPQPKNEPIIGVIDTLFDESVYFSDWVDNKDRLRKELPRDDRDYIHGTEVTSIIVDGASFNPNLDDGCGRFRVRHFGVATSGRFSSFSILREIKEIVKENKDIKVWNLSLGSALEINPNFISPEAAILDQIQYENDVVFVVAGTNIPRDNNRIKRIGAPADSINSLVVNAVGFDNRPASYSRTGPVLSFFNKPDICYYGGDGNDRIRVCSPFGESFVTGTSYAAPWISRKMAYLIHVLGFSREVAKALIVDSAASWKKMGDPSHVIGYGIVPRRIEDIVKSQDDEIRFILSGTSELYDTYNFSIPVPIYKEKQPYIAKATLCYFPKCTRNQGVDYTNTELDLHFGRVKENGGLDTINDNKQSTEGLHYLVEEKARNEYRKWDNIKHICEKIKKGARAKKVYGDGLWGISIKTKERLGRPDGKGIPFGVVVTLKEMNGVNRIEDFIYQCSFKGWLVQRINVENKIEIFNIAEEEISFDE